MWFLLSPYSQNKGVLEYAYVLQFSQSHSARILDWGSVLAKNQDKRKYLMEIFPDNENYIIKVLSCQILKESDRHGETDLIAEVKINACTPDQVYQFITEFEVI